MEQEDDYKSLLAHLQELEQCSDIGTYFNKKKQEMVHTIEAEFEKCVHALAARKKELLIDLESKLQLEEKATGSQFQKEIGVSIKACKDIIQLSSPLYSTYRDAALKMWKNAVVDFKPKTTLISVNFSASLVGNIATHGTVVSQGAVSIQATTAPVPSNSRAEKGYVTTLAGSVEGNSDGNAQSAKFSCPFFGLFSPIDRCFYLSDFANHTIRKITEQGVVTQFSPKVRDSYFSPVGIAHHLKENCFFVCSYSQHSIKKITAGGSGNIASTDGIGLRASFHAPFGLTIDQVSGNLYVAEHGSNMAIRKITPQGEVSTLAGGSVGYKDGIGTAASFNHPHSLCFIDKDNSLIICDYENNRIRRLDLTTKAVTTICGLTGPSGVATMPNGSLIVTTRKAHTVNSVVQKDGQYEITTLAGNGTAGYKDEALLLSEFNCPGGVSLDTATNSWYIVDYGNHKIRKLAL